MGNTEFPTAGAEPARGIDHLVLVVDSLERAAERYARLGFTTTPPARHPFGTGNSLIQFQGNFLELLSVIDPLQIPAAGPGEFSFGAFCQRFGSQREGMAMLVFDSIDARADQAEFSRKGLDTYAPFDFRRQATLPDGREVTVGFSLAFVTHPSMPDAAFFCCQQHAPEHFWRPEYQAHQNTAVGVEEVVMVADAPEQYEPFFAALMGAQSVALEGWELRVATGRGDIRLVTPARFGPDLPAAMVGSSTPRFVAVRVAVRDLAEARRALASGGVPFRDAGDRLRVGADEGFGIVLEFVPAQA
jgi:hypothetical protein